MTKAQCQEQAAGFINSLSKEQRALLAAGNAKKFRASLDKEQAAWNNAARKHGLKLAQSGDGPTLHFPL